MREVTYWLMKIMVGIKAGSYSTSLPFSCSVSKDSSRTIAKRFSIVITRHGNRGISSATSPPADGACPRAGDGSSSGSGSDGSLKESDDDGISGRDVERNNEKNGRFKDVSGLQAVLAEGPRSGSCKSCAQMPNPKVEKHALRTKSNRCAPLQLRAPCHALAAYRYQT
jgi:hypothetical protein